MEIKKQDVNGNPERKEERKPEAPDSIASIAKEATPLEEANTEILEAVKKNSGDQGTQQSGIKGKPKSRVKKSWRRRIYLLVVLLFILSLLVGGGLVVYKNLHSTYERYYSQAQSGEQQLRTAISQLQSLPRQGFDVQLVVQANQGFTAALDNFSQVENGLKSFPSISTSIPVYGSRLSAALHVLPLAIVASQAGQHACLILQTVLARLHNPLNAQNGGLSIADMDTINNQFVQVKVLLARAVVQVQQLQPGDLQLDPRLSKIVGEFRSYLPQVQTLVSQLENLLPVLPTLLGIGHAASYLTEILDSTELRPGGGFIGNYGFVTLSGGRLTGTSITDTYLLDNAFHNAGHSISYPSTYKWFPLAHSSWSLRDSNLDANFPTVARYSEQLYKQEGGKTEVQGVIAITPTFISQILEITGPISVPEYHETVTAQNLIDRIHYYQLGAGRQGEDTPSADGQSSVRKHFTALLAEHLFARVRQLPPSSLAALTRLLMSSLQSKDVQIYLNAPAAESLLSAYHLDSAIQQPAGDSLFVVDANIGGTKANAFITNTLSDQVSIDQNGNVTHHTMLTYAWKVNGNVYGSSLYEDYLRVYTPPGSKLLTQNGGWSPRGSSTAFGRNVWAGLFTLTYGHTATIILTWTVQDAAQKSATGWQYTYLVQRQAGAKWTLNLQVTLPTGVTITNKGGLQLRVPSSLVLHQSLKGDTTIQVDYTGG